MTEFSIKIESILDLDSCEHVLAIDRWIKDSVQKARFKYVRTSFRADFLIGELNCECDNEKEFKQHALGQKITMFRHSLCFYGKDNACIYFSLSDKRLKKDNLFISCQNKDILAEVVSILKSEKVRLENATSITNNINISVENSQVAAITVGDGNKIEAKIEPEILNKENKKSFWESIWQTIISNILWVVVCAIVLLIFAYFGIAKPEWLAF